MKSLSPIIILCGTFILLLPFTITAQTFPPGFTPVQVATGLAKPAAMAFTPDGRILVAEQGGTVRVIRDGTLQAGNMIKLRVSGRGESGLVGITVDPDFQTNQYIYLYYTLRDNSRNRISRFTCNGDVADPSTEKIILALDTLTAPIHNGGAMRFKDGKLYVAIGDNANEANAQNLDTYHGKVIRINADGTAPLDNPFTSGSEQRKRVWSYGFRNPFTFDIQPGIGTIFVNDVGLEKWEEINDVTLPARNYGWPLSEGNSTNTAFTNAVYAYAHGRNDEFGCAITGGTFFNPQQSNYPSVYTGRYFFQDYCSQWIKTLVFSPSSVAVEPFATGIGDDALYLTTGNDGNLYYLVRSTGSLYQVIYSAGEAPAILQHPAPVSVSMGQPASFTVTASGKAPLSYQWQKNDADISGATEATFTIVQTTASDTGRYRVHVFNSSGSALSNVARLTVTAPNQLPVAEIITPVSGTLYRAGDAITFSGRATDAEDGVLPASHFTWFADFHHDTHHHDGPPVASGTRSGAFSVPVRGETSDNVWYRLYLIVTDSQGAADTVFRDIYPRKSTFTLVTQPAGLQVALEGQPMSTPLAVVSVEQLERTIGAVTPQVVDGKTYTFQGWLHGGTESQVISTPLEDTTYTAVYKGDTPGDTVVTGVAPGDAGERKDADAISLFPNPVREGNTLTISYNGVVSHAAEVFVRIVNVTGQTIFAERISCDDNRQAILIDIHRRLPSGVYAVSVLVDQKQFARRLIVR